jgi:hypothetical protein
MTTDKPATIIRPVYITWRLFPDGQALECRAFSPHPHNSLCYARIVPIDEQIPGVNDMENVTLAVENELLETIQRMNPEYKFERREHQWPTAKQSAAELQR